MELTLTPQMGLPGEPETDIHVKGDVLTIDGTDYDLSAVPDGGEGWPEEGTTPIIGPVRRVNGTLRVTVIARLGGDAAADQEGPWVVKSAKGTVTIPAARKKKEAAT